MSLKKFLKPNRIKLFLFFILFLIIFFELPFVQVSSNLGKESLSLFFIVKDYSGSRETLSMILSGFILYFIAAYFISSAIVTLIYDFKDKK
jgi:hypothetical protein